LPRGVEATLPRGVQAIGFFSAILHDIRKPGKRRLSDLNILFNNVKVPADVRRSV
jgi:hypothetical protein